MTEKTQNDTTHSGSSTPNTLDRLVLATLKHAKFGGINTESVMRGASDCDIQHHIARTMLPNPIHDVPAHWAIMLDRNTAKQALALKSNMRIRDKISTLVKHRIKDITPHKVCMKAIFAHLAMPHNSPIALHNLWNTAHAMWIGIGDNTQKSDSNYYTKRTILSAVLFASVAFYLQDDQDDINRFIDERIDDALRLGKLKDLKDLKNFTDYLPYMNHPLKMRG